MSNKKEIFQKKTIDAAVNTIMTKMEELYGANDSDKEIMMRRWVWELIQNANDCALSNKITIWINSDNKQLCFSHNGEVFTYDNMIDLITQISSKRSNEEKTGKFGTGFISTHLISNIIKIKGFYHEEQTSKNYKIMDVDIDRSGETESEIKESIVNVINKIDRLDSEENVEFLVNGDEITTSFIYKLSDKDYDVGEVIKIGCKDLDKCIAFVLVFSKKIKEIHCNGSRYKICSQSSISQDGLKVISIEKSYDGTDKSYIKKILLYTDEGSGVSVATLVEENDGHYYIGSLKDIPKIFCTFPLVGTEEFPFPIVLNCNKFKVLQERNYIQEGAEINRQIIDIGINLYKKTLEYLCINKGESLFNMCSIGKSNKSELQCYIKDRIKEIYRVLPIVDINEMDKQSLFKDIDGELKCNVLIPYTEREELGDELWNLINSLKTKPIPSKEIYKHWWGISPKSRITLQNIHEVIVKDKSLSNLGDLLKDSKLLIPWLNNFYTLWIKLTDECNYKITAMIPNQNGDFLEITKLYIDDNIDDELKKILILLGNDINEKLIYKNVIISDKLEISKIDNEVISDKICNIIHKQLSEESSNTIKRSSQIQSVFNELTDWFLKKPELGKKLFKDIYEMQHLISSPQETIRRLELANTIENTMNENNIEVKQLEIILNESGKLLKMFENGEIELSEDAKQLFKHISSKSIYAKERLDYLIDRSINNVYSELSKNELYSIESTLEKWKESRYSETVFKAIKDERDIRIVIRPSDSGKIIFYEDTELEALDDTDYELWTDDGNGTIRMITLGDLIKTTGISVIPLKKVI